MSELRQCCKCRELRPLTAFHKNRTRKDGLQPECKYCRNTHYDLSIKRKEMLDKGMYDCRKCKRWLFADNFHKDNSRDVGIGIYCKDCVHEYHQANREHLIKQARLWQKANRERFYVHLRTYRQKNKEQFRERYRTKDRLKRKIDPAYVQRRRLSTRKAAYKRYHNDELYRQAMRVRNNVRRTQERDNGGSYTIEEWRNLCDRYGNKCLRCGKLGTYKTLTFDHVIPVVAGGSSDISNGQPLCKSCNSSKGARNIDYRSC